MTIKVTREKQPDEIFIRGKNVEAQIEPEEVTVWVDGDMSFSRLDIKIKYLDELIQILTKAKEELGK